MALPNTSTAQRRQDTWWSMYVWYTSVNLVHHTSHGGNVEWCANSTCIYLSFTQVHYFITHSVYSTLNLSNRVYTSCTYATSSWIHNYNIMYNIMFTFTCTNIILVLPSVDWPETESDASRVRKGRDYTIGQYRLVATLVVAYLWLKATF